MLARLRKSTEENEGGFTLIELLVVMIIIGILAAIAIPAFLNQKNKAKETAAKSDATNISKEVAAALVDGPLLLLSYDATTNTLSTKTAADSAQVDTIVKVSAGDSVTVVPRPATIPAAGTSSYCVTVTPATPASPWTASENGLKKGTTCA